MNAIEDNEYNQAYDWAMEFDAKIAGQMEKGELAALAESALISMRSAIWG